jgi:protein TonB
MVNPAFSQDTASATVKSEIFKKVEIESEFPGGQPAWSKFLNTHLVYPPKAVRKQIEGEVVVQFIVDEKGKISDLQALTGHPLLRNAALDVMRQSPKWIPANQDGKKVKSYKKQPILFRLQ